MRVVQTDQESRVLASMGLLIEDPELIERAIKSAWPKRKTYRWAALKDVFSCGSGVAIGLCRRFKVDPDEMIGGKR